MKAVGFILNETKEVELLAAKMGPNSTLPFRYASLGASIVTRLSPLIRIYLKTGIRKVPRLLACPMIT